MQEPVYVLHLITCHGRIMPRLAELLFPCYVLACANISAQAQVRALSVRFSDSALKHENQSGIMGSGCVFKY